ncbi:type I restriction-modification system subunit M [Oceanithermus sp.]
MNHSTHNKIVNFIWSIADDVLRDHFKRGKYPDIILPMTVIRRFDAVLEPTKEQVLKQKAQLEAKGLTAPEQLEPALKLAAGYPFFNASPFTLRSLLDDPRQIEANFRAYLDGFSENVVDIIRNFRLHQHIDTLARKNLLYPLIEKFVDPKINLSPNPTDDLPGIDNHAMGTIFEELVRRFNEENNEEAGEHFTPRDVVRLMARLTFEPIADELQDGTYLIYDGAAGTGGMLTLAEDELQRIARERGLKVNAHLYGQEVNPETYAIAKADLLLKGDGAEADNIKMGSTLSEDAFPNLRFDFMISNPPYGKNWKTDLANMGGKDGLNDPRFIVMHKGEELRLIPRVSDGQLLFLANKVAKMKRGTPLGSRIAEVHNGSSLFTGDAGSGESNIRRYIIENDWLEAIVALPLNLFYNTGIATYIWIVTNRKPEHRRGKVQLIDATGWYKPLRKNLGKKNRELSEEDIERILRTFLAFEENEHSKIFPNEAFGYYKVTVERPLRLKGIDPHRAYKASEIRKLKETHERAEDAPPVIKKIHKKGTAPDPLRGLFAVELNGEKRVVEYEPDSELRDTEQVPLLEEGGIEAFLKREVLPYASDAWYDPEKVKIGYEINFNRYFYRPKALRPLEEIRRELKEVEGAASALINEILGG